MVRHFELLPSRRKLFLRLYTYQYLNYYRAMCLYIYVASWFWMALLLWKCICLLFAHYIWLVWGCTGMTLNYTEGFFAEVFRWRFWLYIKYGCSWVKSHICMWIMSWIIVYGCKLQHQSIGCCSETQIMASRGHCSLQIHSLCNGMWIMKPVSVYMSCVGMLNLCGLCVLLDVFWVFTFAFLFLMVLGYRRFWLCILII